MTTSAAHTMRAGLRATTIAAALTIAPAATAQDQALITAGAEVYQTHCASCHGERLINPGSSFDLRTLAADERPRFDKALAEGKGQMPAWAGMISAEQIEELWAYIRSRAD
jgi:mono/diheme cytochrome c family protein